MASKFPMIEPLPTPDGPPWLRSAHRRAEIDLQWLFVTFVMAGMALIYFGRGALVIVGLTVASAVFSFALFGVLHWLIRRQSPRPAFLYVLWQGALLGLCTPVTPGWTVPVVGGLMLGAVGQVVGRSRRLRIHPVAVVLALIWLGPTTLEQLDIEVPSFKPQRSDVVLRPGKLVVGDIHDAGQRVSIAPWLRINTPHDAVRRNEPGQIIARQQQHMLTEPDLLPSMYAAGELPAMQELVIGAAPGPVGATSPAVMIFIGLYLMYRQMASWRGAIAAVVGAVAVYMILPIQTPHGAAIAAVRLVDLGVLGSITLIGYVLLALPLPLIVLVLSPSVAPMTRHGRIAYGALLGAGVVTAVWFLAVPEAGYLALILAGLLVRPLDRLQRSPYIKTKADKRHPNRNSPGPG